MPDVIRDIAKSISELAKRVRKLEAHSVREIKYVINVRDYGATGNGTTDDTAAIQAAIDSVGATTYYCNLALYFPAGTYYVTSSIDLTDKRNIVIEGAGGGYDGYATTKILSRADGKPALDLSGSANISFHDLTIHGDSTNSPSCGVLLARSTAATGENSAFNTFRNVFITGYYTISALYSWSSEVNKYDKCVLQNLSTSGQCAVFVGGRNRYSITSDYVTFSATVSSATGRFSDCSMAFYNATSPDGILVLGDSVGNFEFDGGYAQSDLVCPTVEVQGTQYSMRFRNWYAEHTNATITFSFTLYSGGGTVEDFIIDGGSSSLYPTSYFIDQAASHTLNRLYVHNIKSRQAATSNMRFQGTVDEARIYRWWVFDTGTVSFNVLANSEVWYFGHTITVTTLYNSAIIRQDGANNPNHWFGNKSLMIGSNANRAAGTLAAISRVLTVRQRGIQHRWMTENLQIPP